MDIDVHALNPESMIK